MSQTHPAPLLSMQGVEAKRGTTSILTGLCFSVFPGTHMAVMGPNGVGKSTLLELAAGFLRPVGQDAGGITWCFDQGQTETSPIIAREHTRLVSPAQQARYVRQGWRIRGEELVLSGFSNEAMVYGTATEAQQRTARTLAQKAGTTALLDMPISILSQGQLRLLLLLRAMVAQPALLLLDEPYDGLSQTARGSVSILLEHAATHGSTLVFTAHRSEDIPHFVTTALAIAPQEQAGQEQPKHGLAVPSGFYPCGAQHPTAKAYACANRRMCLYLRQPEAQGREENSHGVHTEACAPEARTAISHNPPLENIQPLCQRFALWHAHQATLGTELACTPPSLEKQQGTPPVLMLHDVEVFIDRARVLHDISWSVQPCQHWVVAGENGAGKSTLLRLLYGEEIAAYGGDVLWCGQCRPDLPFFRHHVGYVSDRLQYEYGYDLPAVDIVLSGRSGAVGIYDTPSPEEYDKAHAWLCFFGLGDIASKPFSTLSSGLGRRVLLARAMMCSPALLLLDEPCSGLDPQSRDHYLASLEPLAQAGVQLMYVTHHPAEVPSLFTHELYLDNGTVAKQGRR
ncbi:ATP-binding cassette domain-containing protein [Desulfovibrio cuneatus]|uniref:ATP-binding cassette domain-containing protein n=1 Tax=Desulfovibrio cuneatus TaxID=159728 RepID=UPI0003FE3E6D|nr:ATP-binding cassette domain-containing protein [Desulfovibrio cuneatus]